MKKPARKRFFYFLVMIFILVAPVLVAYSFGYQFNFATGSVEKTGGIFVKSDNRRLSIFLDSVFAKETSFFSGGALLQNVNPGKHLVRVEKPGYVSWSKTITVEPSIVSEFRDVVLTSSPLVKATSSAEEIKQIKEIEISEKPLFKLDRKGNLVQQNSTSTQIIASNVHSFSSRENLIFFVDLNGFLAQIDLTDMSIETVGRPGFFFKKDTLRFIHSPTGEVAIIDEGKGLFLVDLGPRLIPVEGGVLNVAFDEDGEKLLIQKEQELKIMWRISNKYQPFQAAGNSEVILSNQETIRDTGWFYKDNAHVIYRTKSGIFFLEIDGRGNRNLVELISEPTDEIQTTPLLPDKIFYRKNKTWFTIML